MPDPIHRAGWESEPTVEVTAPDGSWTVAVAHRGAALLSWIDRTAGAERAVIDGYRSAAEMRTDDGVRGGVMIPFVNRIADGRYFWAGADQDLLPGRTGDRLVYHGLLYSRPWQPDTALAEPNDGRITFSCNEIRPGAFPGYPHALDARVDYRVGPGRLDVTLSVVNVGESIAPVAMGWHPYFRLDAAPIDEWSLHIPAAGRVETDAHLIPFPGERAVRPLPVSTGPDFSRPRPIGTQVLDVCFTDLLPEETGGFATTVRAPDGTGFRVWQDRGLTHVFTGDTLLRGSREAIAVEPVEAMADAFNRPEWAAALALQPGQQREFRCGVTLLG